MTLEEIRKEMTLLRRRLNKLEHMEEGLLLQECKINTGSIIESTFVWEYEVTEYQIIMVQVLNVDVEGYNLQYKYGLMNMNCKRVDQEHLYDSINDIKEMIKNDKDYTWRVVSI